MYDQIYTFANIHRGFKEAIKGRQFAPSVLKFSDNLEEKLFKIRDELAGGTFIPSPYNHFTVLEPKERHIAAPTFRDIVVQHAIFNIINPIFEKHFIFDSYACRKSKGTHFGVHRIKKFLQASRSFYGKNQPIYFLKFDIAKFFPSISWDILGKIVGRSIDCPKTFSLIEKIITTHTTLRPSMSQNLEQIISLKNRRGLPIGNLTSQLFANIYMDKLDHFVKEKLKARWYGRYMDDFVIIGADKDHLKLLKAEIIKFLTETLRLTAHPGKTFIGNCVTGIDFLGYRIFYDHILVRAKTLRKFYKRYKIKIEQFKNGELDKEAFEVAGASFIGHLKHADTYLLQKSIFGNLGGRVLSEDEKVFGYKV